MSNEEWHKEIPPQGKLCKLENGDIVKIAKARFSDQYGVYLVESEHNYFSLDAVTPLTTEEIWQFMPWQDMDSAPIDEWIIVTRKNGEVDTHIFHWGYQKSNDGFLKWLPLPKVGK